MIEKDMKHNGLSELVLNKAKEILNKIRSNNGKIFRNNLLVKFREQFKLLPYTDINLVSSDILESTFGKYKNRTSENPNFQVNL